MNAHVFGATWSVFDEIWFIFTAFDEESDLQVKNRQILHPEAKIEETQILDF